MRIVIWVIVAIILSMFTYVHFHSIEDDTTNELTDTSNLENGQAKSSVIYETKPLTLDETQQQSANPDVQPKPDIHVYVVGTERYIGHPDYALVFMYQDSGDTAFRLLKSQILEEHESAHGTFRLIGWTNDSKYHWTQIHEASNLVGWLRINSTDWSYEYFLAKEGIHNGDLLNIDTGWLSRLSTAFISFDEYGYEKGLADLREANKPSRLYLYNVIDEREILVKEITNPVWMDANEEWFDDKTLRYTLPDGTNEYYVLD